MEKGKINHSSMFIEVPNNFFDIVRVQIKKRFNPLERKISPILHGTLAISIYRPLENSLFQDVEERIYV